jgi:hypothetical protein
VPSAPTVCCHLRSKGAGVAYGQPIRWENGFYSTAVFWCLHTADPVGPDDGFVHPHVCTSQRACFTAEERNRPELNLGDADEEAALRVNPSARVVARES